MERAYNIAYLEDAMSAVGAMLDYSVNACGEDIASFYNRFLASGIARLVFHASPRFLGGCSGIELANAVANRTGKALKASEDFIDIGSPEYWTGWTLAYLSWFLNMDFRTMKERGLDATDIICKYPTLHEADLTKSVSFAMKRITSRMSASNPLKAARMNAGITQKELAASSGVSLRSIRAYEQGKLSLRNAEYDSVLSLSAALACPAQMLT